jgi:hypothetical protein
MAMYRVRWQSRGTGRIGESLKLFTLEDAKATADHMNELYPAYHHWIVPA